MKYRDQTVEFTLHITETDRNMKDHIIETDKNMKESGLGVKLTIQHVGDNLEDVQMCEQT